MELTSFADQTIDRCESTNDLARALGEAGYPGGTWVSARVQEKGRGRMGRDWVSQEGNLFLSMIFRLPRMEQWTWVPLSVAVTVARAVRNIRPEIDLRIKWPNDLRVGEAKLCGVLCEGVGSRDHSFLIAGVGMNCALAPSGLDQRTAALGLTADQVRPSVVIALRGLAECLSSGDSAKVSETLDSVREFYAEHAEFRPGSRIQWSGGEGKVKGLGPSGELEVILPDGTEKKLFAEDVSAVRARS